MYLARKGVIGRPLCQPRLHRSRLRVAASFNLRSGEFMDQMPYNSEGNEEQTIVSMNFASSSVFVTCARHFPILRDLEDCETLAKESGEEILK